MRPRRYGNMAPKIQQNHIDTKSQIKSNTYMLLILFGFYILIILSSLWI